VNERYILFVVVGVIVSIFGIIAYFALDSQSEVPIQDEVLNITKLNELSSETNEKIKNSKVMGDFKQFVQQSAEDFKKTINIENKSSP
jgi:ABC-type bacteriocin/lantibiotic exporter with double-glycine peptidase domain